MSAADLLNDWTPIRAYEGESTLHIDWCYMSDTRFTKPFFRDTIRERMREPFSLVFRHQTPIEVLGDPSLHQQVIPPTGFIFHMSRCGSTLVAQMLASLESNIVISESPALDSVIALRKRTDLGASDDWLRWMVAALGRRRAECERHYFIKFDSWNTIDLNYIREVFPNVPWIFLYRDPVEVLVSQIRQRGSQMVPGMIKNALPHTTFEEALRLPPEEYCARVLEACCSAALENASDPLGLLVNYEQLPDAVTGSIARHFGISLAADEVAKMEHAAQFDAKSPSLFFESDRARKQDEASDRIRYVAEKWLIPLYRQLEDARNASTDRS